MDTAFSGLTGIEGDDKVECLHCQGRLERGTAPFDVTRHGYHVHFDAVPAWVCTQRGEPLFDSQAVALIEQVAQMNVVA